MPATSASPNRSATWSPRCATASGARTRRCSSTRRAAGCSACGRRWRPNYPAGAALGALWRDDHDAGERAAWLLARLHAFDLSRYGITADCLPVLDVPIEGASDVIGARAYGKEPRLVTALGRAAAEGLMAGGVLPVMKHIPGHGRAFADTHFELPTVDASLERAAARMISRRSASSTICRWR